MDPSERIVHELVELRDLQRNSSRIQSTVEWNKEFRSPREFEHDGPEKCTRLIRGRIDSNRDKSLARKIDRLHGCSTYKEFALWITYRQRSKTPNSASMNFVALSMFWRALEQIEMKSRARRKSGGVPRLVSLLLGSPKSSTRPIHNGRDFVCKTAYTAETSKTSVSPWRQFAAIPADCLH